MTDKERGFYAKLLRGRLSDHRFNHSVCVSTEAVRLAKRYGADIEKAELAGLLHDIMKEAPAAEQLDYMRRAYGETEPFVLASPKLYHAFSGAAYILLELGIEDEDIINSVRYHTTGRAGMSLLEKVVFIADFTSADRKYNNIDDIRRLSNKGLEEAMRFAYSFTIPDLIRKGQTVHPDSLAAYNEVTLQLSGK